MDKKPIIYKNFLEYEQFLRDIREGKINPSDLGYIVKILMPIGY